mmetsp:Transcript_91435/g.295858  ORF Transcript_91435/g.295858 Transcript_91435/m.295858 type:complete len:334 (+) Transcript_91435:53-1054(+)
MQNTSKAPFQKPNNLSVSSARLRAADPIEETVLQSLLNRHAVLVIWREEPPDELLSLGIRRERRDAEVDLGANNPLLDLLHLRRADPILTGLVIEHLAVEGEVTSDQLVSDDPDGKHVRGRGVVPGVGLRRDVLVRSKHSLGLRRGRFPTLRRVEVNELDHGLLPTFQFQRHPVDHHILELEVLVDAALVVHRPHTPQQLLQDGFRFAQWQHPLRIEQLEEVGTSHSLHDDVIRILVFPDAVDACDAGTCRKIQHELCALTPLPLLLGARKRVRLLANLDDNAARILQLHRVSDLHAWMHRRHHLCTDCIQLVERVGLLNFHLGCCCVVRRPL